MLTDGQKAFFEAVFGFAWREVSINPDEIEYLSLEEVEEIEREYQEALRAGFKPALSKTLKEEVKDSNQRPLRIAGITRDRCT